MYGLTVVHEKDVTRYAVQVGQLWLAAAYDASSNGLCLTKRREDACSWSTHERALQGYRLARESFSKEVALVVVEEPDYPASWAPALEVA